MQHIVKMAAAGSGVMLWLFVRHFAQGCA